MNIVCMWHLHSKDRCHSSQTLGGWKPKKVAVGLGISTLCMHRWNKHIFRLCYHIFLESLEAVNYNVIFKEIKIRFASHGCCSWSYQVSYQASETIFFCLKGKVCQSCKTKFNNNNFNIEWVKNSNDCMRFNVQKIKIPNSCQNLNQHGVIFCTYLHLKVFSGESKLCRARGLFWYEKTQHPVENRRILSEQRGHAW